MCQKKKRRALNRNVVDGKKEKTMCKLTIGDPVLLRNPQGIAVVMEIHYTPNNERTRRVYRVRWENIRSRKAVALLMDGRKVWGDALDPIPRG
jgi:hypothetical protein